MTHGYVERTSGRVVTEHFFADRFVRYLYSSVREHAPAVFRAATGSRVSRALGWANYDAPFVSHLIGNSRFLGRCGVDLTECVAPASSFTTPRSIFERQIRYWEVRPMPADEDCVVSPADAKVLIGSLRADASLFVKGKFFNLEELLGVDRREVAISFFGGDAAIFRLTPEKYHYTHLPVSGRVVETYEVGGAYHSCHPTAAIEFASPLSKNRRTVTLIDTDVPLGSQVGLVAMIEVVALMIGRVEPRYSVEKYDAPMTLGPGDFARRGAPKSLFRPGSSTVVVLFQPNRVVFSEDLVANATRQDVKTLITTPDGGYAVETEVRARSEFALAR